MTWKNKKIGEAAERRVIKKIRDGVTIIEDESKIYPDFRVETVRNYESDALFTSYGVEVKTMKGFYEGERVGTFSITREEFNAYEKILFYMRMVLIVEIRPRGYHWSNYIYFVIDWGVFKEEFLKNNPSKCTLSMWWVIKNGVKLETWLKYVG